MLKVGFTAWVPSNLIWLLLNVQPASKRDPHCAPDIAASFKSSQPLGGKLMTLDICPRKGDDTQGGTQKSQSLFIKNCVFILTCLNSSHLQSFLHLMKYTYRDIFSTAQNSFWTCRFWCLLVLCCFLFHLFHLGKTFPFETIFHYGKQEKREG